jgi:hypothetical protein
MEAVMTTASNGVELRDLPSAESTRRDAPRRADSLPPRPVEVTQGDSAARVQFAQAFASKVLAGDSLLYARPVSLADMWAGHQQAAGHYNGWLMRWPRYAWGAFHTALTAVLYALVWVAESPPRLGVAVGVVLGCWFWS